MLHFLCSCSYLFTFLLSSHLYWYICLKSTAYFFDPPCIWSYLHTMTTWLKANSKTNPGRHDSVGSECHFHGSEYQLLRLKCCTWNTSIPLAYQTEPSQSQRMLCRRYKLSDSPAEFWRSPVIFHQLFQSDCWHSSNLNTTQAETESM